MKYNNSRKSYQEGKFIEAISEGMSALELGKKELGEMHPNIAAILNLIAMAYNKTNEWQLSAENYSKAIEIYTNYFGNRHINIGTLYDKLADIYIKLKINRKADSLLALAYQIISDSVGKYNEDIASVRFHQAVSALNQAEYKEAEKYIVETLEIIKRVFTENHNYYAEALSSYGLILFYQGKILEAESKLLEAIRIKEYIYSKKIHPSMSSTFNNLSLLFLSKGNLTEAERYAGLCMKINEVVYGTNSNETINSMISLSIIYKYRGLNKEAEALLLKSVASAEKLYDKYNTNILYAYYNIGLFYLQNEKIDKLKSIINKVLDVINQKKYLATELIYGYNLLGEYYIHLKDFAKAEENFNKSLEICLKYNISEKNNIIIGLIICKILQKQFDAADIMTNQFINDKKNNGGQLNPNLLSFFIKLSENLISAGNLIKAGDYLDEATKLLKDFRFEDHPELSKIYFNSAQIAYLKNDYDKSLIQINKSLEIKEKYFGSYHPDIIKILELKIEIYKKQAKNDEVIRTKEKLQRVKNGIE